MISIDLYRAFIVVIWLGAFLVLSGPLRAWLRAQHSSPALSLLLLVPGLSLLAFYFLRRKS